MANTNEPVPVSSLITPANSADVVEERSLTFLSGIHNLLNDITAEEFSTYKSAVRERINEKSTSISEEAKTRFSRAFELNNNHERDAQSLAELEIMTIDDMKSILSYVVDDATRKSVTVLLYAAQHQMPHEVNTSFEDLIEWKNTRIFQ